MVRVRRRLRQVCALVCALGLAGALVSAGPAAPGYADGTGYTAYSPPLPAGPGMQVVGTFQPTVVSPQWARDQARAGGSYASNLTPIADPAAHALYTVDDLDPAFVAAYHLGSLAPTSPRGLLLGGAVSDWSVSRRAPDLLLAVAPAAGTATTALDTVGLRAGEPTLLAALPLGSALGADQVVVGLARDPGTSLVFVLSVAVANDTSFVAQPVPGTVRLSLVDLTGATTGKRGVLWTQALSGCQLPEIPASLPNVMDVPAPIGFVPARGALDIGCVPEGEQDNEPQKAPLPAGVGVVQLTTAGRVPAYGSFQLDPFPGDLTAAPMGLWVPSLDRLMLQVRSSGGGTEWVAFSGRQEVYVGAEAIGEGAAQAGADPVHGRLFVLSGDPTVGLAVWDAGPTPAEGGYEYPDLQSWQGPNLAAGTENLAVDPTTGRAFLGPYLGFSYFVVVQDTTPYYVAPPAPNVDANTIDAPLVPGVTAATYTGSAQGYGAVIRQVGGVENLVNTLTAVQADVGLGSTRQLVTSDLDSLFLSPSEAQAEVDAARPDQTNTQAELSSAGASWPYPPASCVDFGGSPQRGSAVGASVACDAGAASVRASVVGGGSTTAVPGTPAGAPAVPDLVGVDSTSLTASSTVSAARGLVTTVTSVARGVSLLGGVLRIGAVTVTAQAEAHGRPRTARGQFTRSVSDVVVDGRSLCAAVCNTASLAREVNSALDGVLTISFPTPAPGPDYLAGSPGGYQALVQSSADAQVNAELLYDQPATQLAVPGVQILLNESNEDSAETLVWLAGTQATAQFGIYAVGCSACPAAGPGPRPRLPAVAGATAPASAPATGPAPAVGAPTSARSAARTLDAASAGGLAGVVAHGWRLLVNGLLAAGRLLAVWLILLAPVYLSARRWLLVNRGPAGRG